MDTTNFFIGLYDKKSDLISFPYFVDEKDNKPVISKASESGSLSSEVIKSKKPLVIKKAKFKKRLAKKELKLWGTLPELWLGVPLKIKNEIIGVLGMQSYTNPNLYSEDDIALMVSISDQIAIAIDHKRTEEELEKSEEKWRSLVQNTPYITMAVDYEGIIQFINRTVSGLSVESVTGKKLYDYILPEHHDLMKKNIKQVFKTGKSISYQIKGVGINGKLAWYESSLGPILRDGTVSGVILITIDITKRKRAEKELEEHKKNLEKLVKERTEKLTKANEQLQREIKEREQAEIALRESEEKYRNLVERANDGIAIIQNSIVKYVNIALTNMMGYSINEVIGNNFSNFIIPEELPKVEDRYKRRMKGEDVPSVYETAFFHKDGRRIDIELNAGIIPYEGKPADFVLVRDITERKKAEDKIKSALKEKEVLLREVHHRVKNNIQVITSMLNLHFGYFKDTQDIETFKEIQNRIKSMALIHEKLYQSRDLALVDFNEYIRDLINSLFRFYGINVNEIKPKITVQDVSLGLDAGINELVSNSLKHAFPDRREGEIRIKLQPDNSNKISLIVSDNGIGFPKDLDFKSIKTFGLQLVSTLVEQLDGTIELHCIEGTEFKIIFEPNFRSLYIQIVPKH